MSLKINPTIGIYDLSFRSAVKSLIKDGFIDQELIDSLYAKTASFYVKYEGMTLEDAEAFIRAKFSPWVMLCSPQDVTCVKLEPYGTDTKGEAQYINGGYTRTCADRYTQVQWTGHGTLDQIRSLVQKQNPDKTFVTICHRNSEGVLEPIGYVI